MCLELGPAWRADGNVAGEVLEITVSARLQLVLCRLEGEPNNFYRLLRVYEILLDTGQPLADMDLSADAELDYDFRCFFLHRPRMELYRRIDARCEQMLHSGILQVASGL